MEFVIGAFFGAIFMWIRGFFKRRSARLHYLEWDISNPENQLKFLKDASLRSRKPINLEAFKAVFIVAEGVINSVTPKHRILAEVSMGSFLGTTGDAPQDAQNRAFKSFNSKRVDFLIIDAYGKPKLAIEYHGTGHYLSDDAKPRDAVKRLALERADIPLLEFHAGVTKAEVENKIRWWLTHYNGAS